MLKGLK